MQALDLSMHKHYKGSLFRYDFNTIDEIVYDPTKDMIGDLFGAVFLLRWLKERYPHLKLSWYLKKENIRFGTDWFSDFDVLSWIPLDLSFSYDMLPEDKVLFSSMESFSVWYDLMFLQEAIGWTPKMRRKRSFGGLPQEYIVMHILQTTEKGTRSESYVKRRALDFDKYERLAHSLSIPVVRIGASYDMHRKIKGILDFTGDLTLEDSLRVICGAQVFIGGDTGLKLVASAMGIPCVLEIDAVSKKIGGLGGCDPEIVRVFLMGTSLDILLTATKEFL